MAVALAQWSHKEGNPIPTSGGHAHKFSQSEWDSSNFSRPQEMQWFRDAKYGMFIHFGLSMHNNAELSWGTCYTREAPDAGHAAGMRFGIYYSQRDWYHPDYTPADPDKVVRKDDHWTLRPAETGPLGERHKKYIECQFNVCRELCTKYGKVDVFWFDASWQGGMFTEEMWDSEKLTRMIHELQPGVIINNRASVPGDFEQLRHTANTPHALTT